MLVAILSDIHANIYALEAVMTEISQHKVSLIICAGDIIGYYPFVNETIDMLKGENILSIMGNHDALLTGKLCVEFSQWGQYSLDYTEQIIRKDNLDWLQHLPKSLSLEIEGTKINVFHGSPWHPLTEYIYPDHNSFERFGELQADYVVLGHTHWPMCKQVKSVTVINPGSCGQPRDYKPGACYALIDTQKRSVFFHRVSYDLEKMRDMLSSLKFDQKLIDILFRDKREAW